MKAVTFIVVSVLFLQIEGYLIKVPTTTTDIRPAIGGWVHVQKLLLPLFENVCEESSDPIVVRLSEEFKLDPTNGLYLKTDVLDNFQNYRSTETFLPRGKIFTESDPDQLNELKVIYELLYYAKDFDTFYKAACWARQNINCGLFVDAIYLAIINRRDTEKVSIPAPYEVLPNYFVRKDSIIRASSLMRGDEVTSDWVRNEGNAYILDVNYTTGFGDNSEDQMAYFHEDIGLNSYYFLTKLKYWSWYNDSIFLRKNEYGQYLYHTLKHLMARYNLERYANGLLELEGIDWDYIDESPYDPMLIYSNGNMFGQRTSSYTGANDVITQLKNIEGNLPAVVEHMRDGGYNKSEIMNNLMEILVTGEKSYYKLAQHVLNEETMQGSPSVLGHFMTATRDPIFWKLNKKIVDLVDNVLQILPSYSTNQLYFPGVQVQNIEVKKMITTFDNFEFDVTDALKSEDEDAKFQVKIGQPRLNHKPFTFKISVSSLVTQKALVKIYIGPKLMPGELIEKKNLFMFLDSFEVNLKIGSNLFTRASSDMPNLSEDFRSLETLHKNILDAEFGIDTMITKSVWSQINFPSRLILPKGTPEGLPLHVFVFVAPYMKATVGRANIELNTDAILTPGYPLDLGIEIQQLFTLPNALVKDINIMHKSEGTAYNKPYNSYNSMSNDKIWSSDVLDADITSGPLALISKPEFTKKTFDYKSKKRVYDKKPVDAFKKDRFTYDNRQIIDKTLEINDSVTEKVNDENEKDNVEVVNNIYINREIEDVGDDNKDEKTFHYQVVVDKESHEDGSLETDVSYDFDKVIEIKNSNVKPHGLLTSPKKKFSNTFNVVFKPLKTEYDDKIYE